MKVLDPTSKNHTFQPKMESYTNDFESREAVPFLPFEQIPSDEDQIIKRVRTMHDDNVVFTPLHDNMFIDAEKRFHQRGVLSMFDLMFKGQYNIPENYKNAKKAYCEFYNSQVGDSVPDDIIAKYLMPYVKSNVKDEKKGMIALTEVMGKYGDDNYYVGVNEDEEMVLVMNVEDMPNPTCELPSWSMIEYNEMTMTTFDNLPGRGIVFRIPVNAEPEEIIRRFWILVFNRYFECCWWNFGELGFIW